MAKRLDSGPAHERLRIGDPVLFASEACLIVRRPGMACGVCRDACPVGVLSGTEWSIALEDEGCLACGICAASCPTGALSVEGCTPQVPDSAGERVILQCRRVAAADLDPDAIAVPCLGGLTAPDLLDLVADTDAPIVLADHGWCAACPVGRCADPWRPVFDETKSLLRAIDERIADSLIVETREVPASRAQPVVPALRPDRQVGRREFLRRLVGAVEPLDPRAESRRVVFGRGLVRPVKRGRVRDRIAALAAELDQEFPAALMPAIRIADGCELSGVCAAVCPTGALRLNHAGDTLSLEFDSADCIACGECQRVCPSKALTLWPDGEGTVPGAPVELVARRSAACVGCGRRFVVTGAEDDAELCGFCRRSIGVMRDISAFRSERPQPS
ncbi:MAG: 4Fe-4S binding protein [Bauldia sp.]|nr:4Fe-4S binding protein [Bauldia sp.]